MRTLRAMTGMPVVCCDRRIGYLLQAELSDDMMRLDGIWTGGGLRGTRYIPAECLEIVGRVAVIAESDGRRARLRPRPLLKRATSTDGRRLGAVTGARIDEVSLAVTALELSHGFWDDLVRGRCYVTRYTVNRDSGEVIIEPADDDGEEGEYEERNAEGTDHRHADRRLRRNGIRRHELADGEEVEPKGQADGQLDF